MYKNEEESEDYFSKNAQTCGESSRQKYSKSFTDIRKSSVNINSTSSETIMKERK